MITGGTDVAIMSTPHARASPDPGPAGPDSDQDIDPDPPGARAADPAIRSARGPKAPRPQCGNLISNIL